MKLEIVHGHLESLMVTPAQHYIAECQSGFAEHLLYIISKLMSCVCQLVAISFGKAETHNRLGLICFYRRL